MKLEVLVACMHQSDDRLYLEMNLQTDAILANQCDVFDYKEFQQENGSTVKLISTPDRGVGKNRNKALSFASGEYLLFADEDMVYNDDYESVVKQAFERKKNADIIIFNLKYLNRAPKRKKSKTKFIRLHFWNALRYGAARIAIRKKSLEKATLSFSHLYGGGAPYSSGEDSLFIREAFRKKLKIYYCPITIATVKQENSTWFNGYNEKFFVDKGILIANAFPFLKHFLIYYFAFKMRTLSKEFGFRRILSLLKQGIKKFKMI